MSFLLNPEVHTHKAHACRFGAMATRPETCWHCGGKGVCGVMDSLNRHAQIRFEA